MLPWLTCRKMKLRVQVDILMGDGNHRRSGTAQAHAQPSEGFVKIDDEVRLVKCQQFPDRPDTAYKHPGIQQIFPDRRPDTDRFSAVVRNKIRTRERDNGCRKSRAKEYRDLTVAAAACYYAAHLPTSTMQHVLQGYRLRHVTPAFPLHQHHYGKFPWRASYHGYPFSPGYRQIPGTRIILPLTRHRQVHPAALLHHQYCDCRATPGNVSLPNCRPCAAPAH